jgi:hypothetical protein
MPTNLQVASDGAVLKRRGERAHLEGQFPHDHQGSFRDRQSNLARRSISLTEINRTAISRLSTVPRDSGAIPMNRIQAFQHWYGLLRLYLDSTVTIFLIARRECRSTTVLSTN